MGHTFLVFIDSLQKKARQPYIRPDNLPDHILTPDFAPHNIMFKYQPTVFIPYARAAAEHTMVNFSPAHPP